TFPIHQGDVALGEKVALFLIWQPSGLAPSVLATCRHLREHGYSVLVVANQGLEGANLDAILAEAWGVLVRPNFGYDFGGYRDGLRLLRERAIHPDRLVMMNDSVWYPLYPNDNLLAACEQSSADLTGSVLRRRGNVCFLESYFYSIQGHVLHSRDFVDFWVNYRLTSNKYKVIRRGERGFSHAMSAANFRLDGLFRESDFLSAIESADKDLVRAALAYSAFVDPEYARAAHQLSADGSETQIRDFIRAAVRKHQFYSTFPVAVQRLMFYPVLKKSAEPVSLLWRQAFLRAVDDGMLPAPSPAVLAEARARTKEAVR
ncbi:MAG: rhamnan synthesis F family protein, partial [Paracoccaceae bacterium]